MAKPARKKLLVLGAVPPPIGGATIYFQTLLSSKVAEQFDITFVDLKFADHVGDYGNLSLKKIARLIKYALRLSWLLITNRFALVYAQIQFNRGPFMKDIVFAAICRLFRARVVGCLVGVGLADLYGNSGTPMKRFIKWGVGLYYAFITPGLEMYTRYFPAELLPPEKARVVPFGINTEAGAVNRQRLGADDPVQVIYYSHYIRSKGVDDVVGAIPHVGKKYPNTRFVFAGAWDSQAHQESLMSLVNSNGIARQATFLGVITGETRQQCLRESNIFVLPTYFEFEGLPLSILEAMSYGCALIVTDHAAIGSVIEDGVNGLICRPKDALDVAAKIIELIDDREKLYRIQQNNLKKFQNYTAEKFGERLAAELDALCVAS
jgi:glycosyltransferase involved in cell wall biosynthesis